MLLRTCPVCYEGGMYSVFSTHRQSGEISAKVVISDTILDLM